MNETLKKLSEDTRTALISSIASKAVADLIASTKSAGSEDSGTFKVIVSTADVDRQGDSVNQAGWDLSFFKMNPVVLWAHDYAALPIGVCTSIEVKDGKLIAEGKFAPSDANPFAQQVRRLYDLGMVNTTSVGFIPKEFDNKKDGVISKSELLEFSFVPVPANAYALRLDQVKKLNIDIGMLVSKGINIKEDENAPVIEPKKEEEAAPAAAATEEAKPADQVTPAPEEQKGVVAERLEEIKKMKWIKYRSVMDAFDAFVSVYFAEGTPTEDFGKLLLELAEILKSIAGSDGSEETEKGIDEKIAKILGGHASIREEYQKNIESIKSLIDHTPLHHFALGDVTSTAGDKNGKGEAVKQRSTNLESLKEVTNFVDAREVLRKIDFGVELVLEAFNKAARDYSAQK